MGTVWRGVGSVPPLEHGSVQVWRVDLAEPLLVDALLPLLDGAELARGERTRAGTPRDEFIVARGVLRWLLGAVTGQEPGRLEFEAGAQGKPALAGGAAIDFNVSHSGGCVLLALSRAGGVGIDLEPTERTSMYIEEALELARANFHPEEIASIAAQPDAAQQLAAFYRCWTRKEAVVKADGRGLYIPLTEFFVLGEGDSCCVEIPGGRAFWVRNLDLAPGFAAALAVPEREIPLTFHTFEATMLGNAGGKLLRRKQWEPGAPLTLK